MRACSQPTSPSNLPSYWPMVIVAVLAMTLRPLMTSTGPLIEEIRLGTGISLQVASLLTVLPMACMGVFPLLMPWLGKRLSESAWITTGLIAIAIASMWRLWLGSGMSLMVSTLLGGSGIAIVQALAPGVVKRWYPSQVALAMGIYSASLMAGGGLAATLSPQIAEHFGHWQLALGCWVVIPIIALLLWWFRPIERIERENSTAQVNFFGNRRAWLLGGYFGLANGGYACMIAWLPSYARTLGFSSEHSGELIGWMTIFQIIGALAVPIFASANLDRRPWLRAAVGSQLIGFVGLLLLPSPLLMLWVAMIGCGLGACFSLTLTVALDHLSSPKLAGTLTAFVQGIGFIITAIIPYLAGVLLEWTGDFQTSWLMLIITLIAMLIVTHRFAPSGYAQAINAQAINLPDMNK